METQSEDEMVVLGLTFKKQRSTSPFFYHELTPQITIRISSEVARESRYNIRLWSVDVFKCKSAEMPSYTDSVVHESLEFALKEGFDRLSKYLKNSIELINEEISILDTLI